MLSCTCSKTTRLAAFPKRLDQPHQIPLSLHLSSKWFDYSAAIEEMLSGKHYHLYPAYSLKGDQAFHYLVWWLSHQTSKFSLLIPELGERVKDTVFPFLCLLGEYLGSSKVASSRQQLL
jgi:hypothetical protein